MNDAPWKDDDALPPTAAQRVDEACDRFEAAWKTALPTGPSPRIEDYLRGVNPPEQPALLRALIELDVYYRRLHGVEPRPEDYVAAFPALDEAAVARWIRECPAPPESPGTVPGAGVAEASGDPSAWPSTVRGTDDYKAASTWTDGERPHIPGYEVLGELGRGGMGVVYQARQLEPERLVALKMIRSSQLAGAEEVQLFRREANEAARLDHPNIVPVYEVGEHAGQHYFTMKLVAGGSLARNLGRYENDPRSAAQLTATLARAVHYAHQRQLLHRDLKPGNVLLDAENRPYVADFGLAKRMSGEGDASHGVGAGTPEYMAPEQARGEARLTTAADVYALGGILYALLAGRPPFRGGSSWETIRQVLGPEPVPPPSTYRRHCPHDLETICLKCLEKTPARRYGSAEALAEDLERWLRGEPVLARPVGRWERLQMWRRRNPLVAGLFAGIVGLFVFTFAAVTVLWLRAEEAKGREKAQAIAKAKAEEATVAAEAEKWRNTLAELHAKADLAVGKLRSLRHIDGPDVGPAVFGLIAEVAALRSRAEAARQQAGPALSVPAVDEPSRWETRAADLRHEATRWLLRGRLSRGRSIPLPERSDRSLSQTVTGPASLPSLALRPDLKQVALVYPGDPEVVLLDQDGREQQRLPVPLEFARKALTVRVETRTMFGFTNTASNPVSEPAILSYVGTDRLEYRIGEQVLAWSLPGKEPRLEQRPQGLPPWWVRNRFVAGERYLAYSFHSGYSSSSSSPVTLREWSADAREQVVWQPREAGKAGNREWANDVAFAPGGRALFIRTSTRLSVVDADGGSATEASLEEEGTKVEWGPMIPCGDGVAVVERRTGARQNGRPRLVFWTAGLPRANLRGLQHDDAPRSLDWAEDGLLVVGAGDHRVHAWRGRQSAWKAGIPYLAREQTAHSRTRIPVAAIAMDDRTAGENLRTGGHSSQKGWKRMVYAPGAPALERFDTYRPPPPYPFWQFSRTGSQGLVVARRELLPDGGSRVRTEVYDPETGELEYAFPAEGDGRILHASEDHRFAVVVAQEKDNRCTLDVWSLPEHRRLGSLGRYASPPRHPTFGLDSLTSTFTTVAGKDWLLFGRPLPNRAETELGVWRLPKVEEVGRLIVPAFGWTAQTDRPQGQVVLTRGFWLHPPVYGQVVDLETAKKVCDLQRYDVGESKRFVYTGSREINVWRRGLEIDPCQVSAWDLTTGKRTDLGGASWISNDAPGMLISPAGDRLLLCGNLHESGKAHVELWDLNRLVLVKEATLASNSKPWADVAEESYCGIGLADFPAKGRAARLYWKWTDGEETREAPPTPVRLVHFSIPPGRSWEWFLWRDDSGLLLQHGAGSRRVPLENTSGLRPSGVVYPPSGKRALAIEGEGGGIWDADTGRRLARLEDNRFRCFDPTEQWALTVNAKQGEFIVWDLRNGKAACRCRPRDSADPAFDPVEAEVQLHHSGKRLAVLSQGVLRLWDLKANRQVLALPRPGHLTPVNCVAQHAGAGLVASGGDDGVIHLWKRGDGAAVRALLAHASAVSVVIFRPDGRALASAAGDGELALHDLSGRRLWIKRIPDPAATITHLRFSARGLLLVATSDGRAMVLDPGSGKLLRSQQVADADLRALALSPDGSVLALGNREGRVSLWDAALEKNKPLRNWNTYAPVQALAFLDAHLLATGGPTLRFWETATGQSVWDVEVPGGAVRTLALNDRTGELAVGNGSDRLITLDLPELYRALEERKLGFAAFPRSRWPRRGAAPSLPRPPRDWQEWTRWAEQRLRDDRWEEAVWASSTAIQQNPEESKPWALRAEAYSASPFESSWELAVEDYSRAVARKKDDARLWQRRAAASARLGRWRDAEHDLTRAIELKAPGAEVRYRRGEARFRLRRYDPALTDLEEAVRLDPKRLDAVKLRGEVRISKGEIDKALADLDKVRREDAHSARAHALLGNVHRRKGDYKTALVELDAALRLEPDYPFAHRERGRVYYFTGNLDGALVEFTEAILLEPNNAEPYHLRAIVQSDRRDHVRCIGDCTDAIRLDPENAHLYFLRGEARRLTGASALAVADFDRALRLDPKLPRAHYSRGKAHQDRRDYDKAVADFSEAIRLDPRAAVIYNDRGLAYAQKKQFAKARADYDEASRLAPNLVYPYRNRGDLNAEAGEWDKAAADFARAVELLPQNADLRWRRALALLGGGDKKGYSLACQEFLPRYRQTANAGLASLAAWTAVLAPDTVKDVQPYLHLVERAAAGNPNNYVFAYTLGAALYRAGSFEDAARQLAAANKLHGAGGTPYDHLLLALTHARLGRAAEAGKWLDKAGQRIDQAARARSEMGAADEFGNWLALLELQLLRREAESLVKAARP